MYPLIHVLSGLEVGGKERVALQLARRGLRDGLDHRLLLFDTPFRGEDVDLHPGDVPVTFVRRGPGIDWQFAARLRAEIRATEAAVLHAYNDTALFYVAFATLGMRRRPGLVGTFHTRPGHDTWGARLLTRWASRRVDCVTSVSSDLSRYLEEHGWVARCETLWNGIDLEEFAADGPGDGWRERLSIPSAATMVTHIGRFDPVKRHVDLLAAAARLRDHESLHFVLVGQGPRWQEMRDAAAGLARVHFVPRVVDVAGLLRESDVFVLCSDQEAAPRVILEAMACGRPVVTTDAGGARALLTEDDGAECGVVVERRRPEALAAAIAAIAADGARRNDLGNRARARASAFSAEREWERYRAVYARAVASRRGGRAPGPRAAANPLQDP